MLRRLSESMSVAGVIFAILLAAVVLPTARPAIGAEQPGTGRKPFGLEKVIAFYGGSEAKPVTFCRDGKWKDWQDRGGVASRGLVHYKFLRKTVAEATDYLAKLDFGDNPRPVIDIDEFGWDYDGGIDRHSAAILTAVHKKRPELKIAVWQMRGPVAPKLAAVYRRTVELVMMETYFDLNDAWMIAFQLQTARLNGILPRSVVALGLGKESEDKGGWMWTRTKDELDQQVRLIRLVAPESPGVAFFGRWKLKENKCPLTDEQLDDVCGRFLEIQTDGSGLKPELLKLGKTFTKHYDKAAIFCSSAFVLPYFHSGHDGGKWGEWHKPPVARVLMMNLGRTGAKDVQVRLRDRTRGVWAAGAVDLPPRSVVVALLPIPKGKGFWGWGGTSLMEVDAPGCEVFNFLDSRHHGVPAKKAGP